MADYLYQGGNNDLDRYNPAVRSIQCGRRNDALKIRTALKFLGQTGYEKRINNQFKNARYAVEIIKKDNNFTLVMEPE
ncbi:hypothetical protein KBC03_07515 [Patescibacteria group bacterium]|nr:hypothetical protein [Patescibacteria group bacterium]